MALGLQRGGQIRGHRRLTDSALARCDADHVLHPRQRTVGELGAAEALLKALLLIVTQDVEANRHLAYPLKRAHLVDNRLLEVVPDRAARCGERDHDLHSA